MTVLVAAGWEPSGRMGLLADLESCRLAGVSAVGICTAVTAQGEGGFARTRVPPDVVRAQVTGVLTTDVRAVKFGMVPTRAVLDALMDSLAGFSGWRVVDPVVRSSSGARLSSLRPADFQSLAHEKSVLTPNALEAAWLLGHRGNLQSAEDLVDAAKKLFGQGWGGVLVKGGHLPGDRLVDVLVTRDGIERLTHRKLPRTALHRGTGCRHASTLTATLALGGSLSQAARAARRRIQRYLGTGPARARGLSAR